MMLVTVARLAAGEIQGGVVGHFSIAERRGPRCCVVGRADLKRAIADERAGGVGVVVVQCHDAVAGLDDAGVARGRAVNQRTADEQINSAGRAAARDVENGSAGLRRVGQTIGDDGSGGGRRISDGHAAVQIPGAILGVIQVIAVHGQGAAVERQQSANVAVRTVAAVRSAQTGQLATGIDNYWNGIGGGGAGQRVVNVDLNNGVGVDGQAAAFVNAAVPTVRPAKRGHCRR